MTTAENASTLPNEPGARNDDLYDVVAGDVFVGDDVEFFIGGAVARLPDFRPRLRELAMPTLVIAGRYDRAPTRAISRSSRDMRHGRSSS